MARATSKAKRNRRAPRDSFVRVTSTTYGKKLRGTNIYYEGEKPSSLRDDGAISCGKHTLEALLRKFKNQKFRWILTEERDDITLERNIYRVRTSVKTMKRMDIASRDRTREIKNDIVAQTLAAVYPGEFSDTAAPVYVNGMLARVISKSIIPRLSSDDRRALNEFLPDYVASESASALTTLNAQAQIKSLKELASHFEKEMDANRSENWWQSFIHQNILLIQQGYIKPLEKLNVAIGNTKFPDFALVTHDNYLDILEIKTPQTPLLKHDTSRDNYYWDGEMARAIVQVENYIAQVERHSDVLRNYIRDRHHIDLRVIRPRAILLAGDARVMSPDKKRDDFRLLSQSTKNVVFVTYDEMLRRLQNYIGVLESYAPPKPAKTKNARTKASTK